MVRRSPRARWNVEHEHASFRMRDLLQIDPETDGSEELLGRADDVRKGTGADN